MAGIFLAVFFCVSNVTTLKAQPMGFPGVDPDAVLLDDFENGSFSGWATRPGTRGEIMSFELMDAERGDKVRFGRYALKVNIDFTNAQHNQTLVAQVTPTTGLLLPNHPAGSQNKRIGMWLYASPGVYGLWMRLSTRPAGQTAGVTNTDFRSVTGNQNINWTGWRYIEADWPNGHEFHPDAIRFVVLNGFPNYFANGYVIIDNIRITDRGFAEDRTPPVITSLTGNGVNLTGTFTTSTINLVAVFDDPGSPSSGINYDAIRILVNGQPFGPGDDGFAVNQINNTVALSGVTLPNGTHNVVVHVEDNFGHITTRTAQFIVDAEDGIGTATLEVDAEAHVGNVFEMRIKTDDSKEIRGLNVVLHINDFGSVAPTGGVVFAPSAQGSTYSFNAQNGQLTINLVNDITADAVETLATINVDVVRNSNPTDVLRISPVTSNITFADNTSMSFSLFNAFARNVRATYDFTVSRRIVGVPGEVLVTDLSGNPQSGATVRVLNQNMTSTIESVVTNADGIASGMIFTNIVQGVNIYVEKDEKFSYTTFLRTLNPLLTSSPTNIMSGTNIDPTTMKTITWQSSVVGHSGNAFMRLAKKADGESNFQEITGRTQILEYTSPVSSGAAMGSMIRLEGLEPGTTYIYQVGDGVNWSPTREFTTTASINRFSFAAFGDLQATTLSHMDRWLAAAATIEERIAETGIKPFFQLNVGDIVDTDDRWNYFEVYGHLYNQRPVFANIDRIFAFGNHEYMGTPDADNIKFMSGIPGVLPAPSPYFNYRQVGTGSYASIYGNMVVVALDWESRYPAANTRQHMQAKADWMDYIFTKYAHKTWRIVTLHYPIFPAASTAGSQEIYGPVFDRHNVNIVFCGHGHRHRRVQVRDGVVTSPPGNMTTFQPTIDGGTLHFEIGDIRRDALHINNSWVFAEVDGARMTVTVRDANNNISPAHGFVMYAGENHKVEFSVVNEAYGTLTAIEGAVEIFTGQQILAEREIVFRAVPNSGYRVKAWTLDGVVVDGETGNTFTLASLEDDVVVTVEFEYDPRPRHTVTFSVVNNVGGTLTAVVDGEAITSGDNVLAGSNVVFTATPHSSYVVKAWTLNGTAVADNTEYTYTLTNLQANATVTVEFEQSVGVCNPLFANLQMFPNPFTNVIQIAGAENSFLQVMNVLGAVVYTQQITEANQSIHLGALSSGIYFFRLERDGQVKTMKVVKQ